MHLTPRTLLLTAAATLTACTLVGIIGTLDRPAPVAADTGNTTSLSQTPTSAPSDSVDTSVEAASRALATAPAEPELPTPTAVSMSPSPIASSPTPSASAPATTSRSEDDGRGESSAAQTRKPTPRDTTPPPPTPPRSAPTPRRTVVKSWRQPPTLHVGITSITRPRLNSGARVSVTVACAPGRGCSMSGTQLQVAAGTSVTVTWSAPARPGYTAWRTSRVL
jgi:hypothetical protein